MSIRRIKIILGVLLAILLLAGVFYAVLPWLLPQDMLRRQVLAQVRRDYNRDAEIESVSVSWAEGFQIHGLTIFRRPGFGEGAFFRAQLVRFPFEPLKLISSQPDVVAMQDVTVTAVLTEAGHNLIDLPPFDMKSLQVEDATLCIESHLDDGFRRTAFRLADISVEKDNDHGPLRVSVTPADDLTDDEPLLRLDGQWGRIVTADAATPPHAMHLEISRLGLNGLGLDEALRRLASGRDDLAIPALPSGPLTGRLSLDLDLGLDPAGHLKMDTNLAIAHLSWPGPDNATVSLALPELTMQCSGTVDLSTHTGRINRFAFDTPGLHIGASGRMTDVFDLDVAELRCDPKVLAEGIHVPGLEAWRPYLGSGPVRLAFDIESNDHLVRCDVGLDATDWQLDQAAWTKPAGERLGFEAKARFDRRIGRLEVEPATFTSDLTTVNATVNLERWDALRRTLAEAGRREFSPGGFLADLLRRNPGLHGRLALHVPELAKANVPLARLLAQDAQVRLAGPLDARLDLADQDANLKIDARLALPADSHIRLAAADKPLFDKPAGRPLTVELQATIDPDPLALAPMRVAMDCPPASARLDIDRMQWNHSDPLPIRCQSGVEAYQLPALLDLVPETRTQLENCGVTLGGDAFGILDFRREEGEFSQVTASFDLSRTIVRYADPDPNTSIALLDKSASEPASIQFLLDREPNESSARFSLDTHLASTHLQAEGLITPRVPNGGGSGRFRLGECSWDVEVADLNELTRLIPRAMQQHFVIADRRLYVDDPQGRASCRGSLRNDNGRVELTLDTRADRTVFRLIDETDPTTSTMLWDKKVFTPLSFQTDATLQYTNSLLLSLLKPDHARPHIDVQIKEFTANVGPAATDLSGHFTLANPPDHEPQSFVSALTQAQFQFDATLRHDPNTLADFPPLAPLLTKLSLTGQSALHGRVDWDQRRNRLAAAAEFDLKNAAFACAASDGFEVVKPPRLPLRLAIDASGATDPAALILNNLSLQVGPNRFTLAGQLDEPALTSFLAGQCAWPAQQATVQLDLYAPDLNVLASCLPSLAEAHLAGRAEARGDVLLQFEPAFTVYCNPSHLDTRITAQLGGEPVRLEIQDLDLSSTRLLLPSAQLAIGDNQLTFVADVQEPLLTPEDWAAQFQHPRGSIDLLADRLDADQLQAWLADLVPSAAMHGSGSAGPGAADMLELSALRRWNLQGLIDVGHLRFTDPTTRSSMDLEPLRGRYTLDDGRFDLGINAGLSSGAVEINLACDLNEPNAIVTFEQVSRDLEPISPVRALVESEFPGLKVSGKVSEKYTLSAPLAGLLAGQVHWQGSGITRCQGGTLYGPGAPDWVARLFPGLQLVEYPFVSMTNEFTRHADGSKDNAMIFTGETYDIFIQGASHPVTDPDQLVRLYATLEKELADARERLGQLDAGDLKLSPAKADLLRERVEHLQGYQDEILQGKTLGLVEANYVVGAIISGQARQRFDVPSGHLRTPFFRSHSYVIGRQMIDQTVRSYLGATIAPGS